MSSKKYKKNKAASVEEVRVIAEEATPAPKPVNMFPQHWLLLIVFSFGFLLYVNTFQNQYAVDDTIIITSNRFTQAGFEGISDILTTDAFEGHFGERGKTLVAGGRYRPLSIVSFAIEIGLWGKNHPQRSHLINAILYGLLGIVSLLFLQLILPSNSKKPWYVALPFWITMLYLAHPIHTEAIANIKGRDELMGMLFSMLALYGFTKYVVTQKIFWLPLSVFVYFLALLSKENAITFLAIVPITYYVFTNASRKNYIFTMVSMLIVAAVFLYLRNAYTAGEMSHFTSELMNNPFLLSSFSEKYGTIIYTFLVYLKLLFIPHPLTHDYYPWQIPKLGLSHPLVVLSILLNLALVLYALWKIRTKDHVAYGILFAYFSFSVVSQIFFTVGTNMNERFLFMPSFGFCFVIACLLNKAYENKAWSKVSFAALGIILVLFSVKTFSRNMDWENDFVLFEKDVQVSTQSAKLNMAYGGTLIDRANAEQDTFKKKELLTLAIQHLELAVALYGDTLLQVDGRDIPVGYANAYNLLGNAYYTLNQDMAKAEQAYKMAAYYRPGHFDAFQNLVVIYNDSRRWKESIPYLRALIDFKPIDGGFYYKLADAFKNTGEPDSAIKYFNISTEVNPDLNAQNTYQIGLCYGRYKNDLPKAIEYLNKASALDPTNLQIKEDLGVAFAMSNQPNNAIPIFRSILSSQPQYLNVIYNLSLAYRSLGRIDSAEYYLKVAQSLNPQTQQ